MFTRGIVVGETRQGMLACLGEPAHMDQGRCGSAMTDIRRDIGHLIVCKAQEFERRIQRVVHFSTQQMYRIDTNADGAAIPGPAQLLVHASGTQHGVDGLLIVPAF